ncbi:MAG: hypothetical protein LLG06_19335 [Desulfobacteraceae bacterium]|nr:hypothetical protein [Desulfobacteraceae bacterium]
MEKSAEVNVSQIPVVARACMEDGRVSGFSIRLPESNLDKYDSSVLAELESEGKLMGLRIIREIGGLMIAADWEEKIELSSIGEFIENTLGYTHDILDKKDAENRYELKRRWGRIKELERELASKESEEAKAFIEAYDLRCNVMQMAYEILRRRDDTAKTFERIIRSMHQGISTEEDAV